MSNEVATQELNTIQDSRTSSLALITNDGNMQRMMSLAKLMASSKVTVPKHLQGNEGDCMAIIIQATNWGMNPFAVAQKTHLVNSTLGYEAQLVNAVIQASGAIHGAFEYEYRGDGAILECRVGAILRGKSAITWGEWLCIGLVTTRNSPLWKTNPKQQLGYLQVKNWGRAYCPGAILGVYTTDELEDQVVEKNMGTIDAETGEIRKSEIKSTASLPAYTDEQMDANIDSWQKAIDSGKTTPQRILAMVSSKFTLSADQADVIRGLQKSVVDPFVDAMNRAESQEE